MQLIKIRNIIYIPPGRHWMGVDERESGLDTFQKMLMDSGDGPLLLSVGRHEEIIITFTIAPPSLFTPYSHSVVNPPKVSRPSPALIIRGGRGNFRWDFNTFRLDWVGVVQSGRPAGDEVFSSPGCCIETLIIIKSTILHSVHQTGRRQSVIQRRRRPFLTPTQRCRSADF